MASTNDARDILDAKVEDRPRPIKKQKTGVVRPKGTNRELFGLYGDRAAPVVIEQPTYRARPKWTHKVLPWEQSAFTNPARTDGLALHHWRKKKIAPPAPTDAPNTPADLKTEHETDTRSTQTEPEYHFAKFDIKVTGPEYNDEQYESLLKSNEWSKEETDYLIDLALDFDLRWIPIADRYDYQPKERPSDGDAMAVTVTPKPRTMEDMKGRYYDVAAKMMVHHHPLSSMSTTEFDLYEKMTKFDPVQETTRKKLAEALLARSPEEIREEDILLGELKRIVVNEDRFAHERKELYARLEAPQSTGSIVAYESSQGLQQLMNQLMAVDKSKRQRRSLMGPGDGMSSPAPGASGQNLAGQANRDQRNSIGSSAMKKGSMSGPSNQRQLTPREEAKYGVTHHERLTSGVQLRQWRLEKLMQAKSQAQSKKLDDALRELQIPHKAVMATIKVCNEYERLVQNINILLDVRKVSEKVENEIKVLQAQKEYREKKESGETATTPQASSPAAEADGDGDGDGDEDVDPDQTMRTEADDDEDAEGEADDADVDAEEAAKESGDDGEGEEDEENDAEAEAEEDVVEDEGNEDEGNEDDDGDDDGGSDAEPGEEDAANDSGMSDTRSRKGSVMRKRSVSVLSMGSEKSAKRQRK
ncbi:swr complex subunit [Trapelia coarctata]|nr:swr complex subunit [Trapelia coarctata]